MFGIETKIHKRKADYNKFKIKSAKGGLAKTLMEYQPNLYCG